MVINVFPYGVRHALKGHTWYKRSNTTTQYGVYLICHTCLKTEYYAWQTRLEVINAEIYLQIKNSPVLKMLKDREE